jgi:hypothetical protein
MTLEALARGGVVCVAVIEPLVQICNVLIFERRRCRAVGPEEDRRAGPGKPRGDLGRACPGVVACIYETISCERIYNPGGPRNLVQTGRVTSKSSPSKLTTMSVRRGGRHGSI